MSKVIKDISQFQQSSECCLKFLRIMEYSTIFTESLFRSNPLSKSETKIADDFHFCHTQIRKYRRLLKVFRFISQFYKFKLYYQQQHHVLAKLTVLTSKTLKQIYYIFDTIQSFYDHFSTSLPYGKPIAMIKSISWFFGLLIDSIFYITSIRDSLLMEEQLKNQAVNGPLNAKECLYIINSLINERWKIVFMIFSNVTDMVLASHYMGLMKWALKTQLSQSWEGIVGVVCELSRLRNIIKQFRDRKSSLVVNLKNEDELIANRFRKIRNFEVSINDFVSKENLHSRIKGILHKDDQTFDVKLQD